MRLSDFSYWSQTRKEVRNKQRNNPTFWVRPGRTSIWWDNVCEQVVDSEWKETFRMTRQSFLSLCLKKVD